MPKETRAPSLNKVLGPMSRNDRASFLLKYAQLYAERMGLAGRYRKSFRTTALRQGEELRNARKKPKAETLEDLEAEVSWFGYRPHPDGDPTPRCLEDGEEEVREAEGPDSQVGSL